MAKKADINKQVGSMATVAAQSYYMYRCTKCGRWSHAKKKPKWHTRFIRDTESRLGSYTAAEQGLDIHTYVPGYWNGDPSNDGHPGGVIVGCGPFETYVAFHEDTLPHG